MKLGERERRIQRSTAVDRLELARDATAMVDEQALQAAYNDAVAKENNKLAKELLALWRDARAPKHSLSNETDGTDPSGQ